MKRLLDWIASQVSDPIKFRRLNGMLCLFWLAMFPISIIFHLAAIVAFVSYLSIYANWATHLSGWAASRAEAQQVEMNEDT